MSTTTVVLPAKNLSGFESFFTKFGTDLKNIANVDVNVAEQEAPVIDPVLPPATASSLAKLISAAAAQVSSADVKYAQIGASNVPYAVKVAEAVAVGGQGVLAIAAQEGLAINQGQLATFFSAAGQIASTLNLSKLTSAPALVSASVASAPAASSSTVVG